MTKKLLCLALAVQMLLGLFGGALASEPEKYSEEYDLMLEQQELERWSVYPEVADGPTYDITWYGPNQPYSEDVFAVQMVEKLFNINLIPLLRGGDNNEALRTMLAAGETPDVFRATASEVAQWYGEGILAPIDEETIRENMPGYTEVLLRNAPNALKIMTNVNDGHVMGLPTMSTFYMGPVAGQIRADWLKAVGIDKVPETLDELEEAFRRFRNNDPDGNGQVDTYALSAASDWGIIGMFQTLFGAYGVIPTYWEDVDGELVLGITQPEFVDALERLGNWYAEGLIDPEFITDKARQSQFDLASKFAEGRIGYLDHLNFDDTQWDNDGHVNAKWMAVHTQWFDWFMENQENEELIYSVPNVTDFNDEMMDPYYITMPPVKGPVEGSGYVQGNLVTGGGVVIGEQVLEEEGKLERILFMLEKMFSDPELNPVMANGLPGIFWERLEDGGRRSLPDQALHARYHPQNQYQGTGWWICPWVLGNPDLISAVGGGRMEQRYGLGLGAIKDFPSIQNACDLVMPTTSENPDLMDSMILEYITNSVIDGNVRDTYDEWIQEWLDAGGAAIIEETNAWYQATSN